MREDQVENGVKFLVHPKVKTAPMSQRISFLENKGLTSEEISAAMSRVEGQGGSDGSESPFDVIPGSGNGGNNSDGGAFSSRAPFPAEPSVPLWRKVAVPGALVLGAVCALGTYRAASRSAASLGQNGDSTLAAGQPYSTGAGTTNAHHHAEQQRGGNGTGEDSLGGNDHVPDGFPPSNRVEAPGVDAYSTYERDQNAAGTTTAGAGASGESSVLAGEFRRLTETMEQQTEHLVEAVGAMKALASRAEQDSSSLLAARVSSHTSEIRAEISTIKQLLLLQAGGAGGVESATVAGVIDKERQLCAERADSTSDRAKIKGTGHVEAPSTANGHLKPAGANGADVSRTSTGAGSTMKDNADKEAEKEDTAAAEAAVVAATERRKEAARAALTALLADNSPQAAKDGIAMLRMLVANLVKQPNVPRYRRITTSNDNFKKRLLPLEGHRAMMEAVGFKAKGSLWEWTWHEDIGPSAPSNNKAVLEDIVAAIDAVARPNGPPLPTSPPPGPTTTVASCAPTAAAAATAATTPGVLPTNLNTNGGNMPGADGLALKVGSAGVVGAAGGVGRHAIVAQESVPRKGMLAAAAEVNRVIEDDAGELGHPCGTASAASVPAAAGTSTDTSKHPGTDTPEDGKRSAEAAVDKEILPPSSMAEVAAAIERGEEPPGIKVVEDRLSASAPGLSVSSTLSPPKPWETASGAAVEGMQGPAPDTAAGEMGGGGVRGYLGGEDGKSLPLSPSLPPHSPHRAVSVGP